MGDRGNIVVTDGKPGDPYYSKVYLYSHWGGHWLPLTVQRTLKRRQRWNDGDYLARMLFGQAVRDGLDPKASDAEIVKEFLKEETGYGIASRMGDNEHDLVVVDVGDKKVRYVPEKQEDGDLDGFRSWSFEEFTGLSKEEILENYR